MIIQRNLRRNIYLLRAYFILLHYSYRIFCIYKPFFDVFDEIETNNGKKMTVDRKIAQNK